MIERNKAQNQEKSRVSELGNATKDKPGTKRISSSHSEHLEQAALCYFGVYVLPYHCPRFLVEMKAKGKKEIKS